MPLTPIAIQQYKAYATQSGTSVITITKILQNTMQKPVSWIRDSRGIYVASYGGTTFPPNTVCPPFGDFTTNTEYIPIGGTTLAGYYTCNYDIANFNGKPALNFVDTTFGNVDMHEILPAGQILIQIDIYQ